MKFCWFGLTLHVREEKLTFRTYLEGFRFVYSLTSLPEKILQVR